MQYDKGDDTKEEEEITKDEIGESTYKDITSDETTSEKSATQKTATPIRKSSRIRKPPSHLKDFVRKMNFRLFVGLKNANLLLMKANQDLI